MKRSVAVISIVFASLALAFAQNNNTTAPSKRTRTVDSKPTPTPKTVTKSANPEASPSPTPPKGTATTIAAGPSAAVLAAFDKIIEGVRRANVDMATNGYWKSPALNLFNYDGSVTRGWDQMRKNREGSYPDVKDNKLETPNPNIVMLGRDGAVVTCLWTQSRLFRGQPENYSGRMTLVFKRFGTEWKAVHLHTSADKPDASRIPPSEQTRPATSKPSP